MDYKFPLINLIILTNLMKKNAWRLNNESVDQGKIMCISKK